MTARKKLAWRVIFAYISIILLWSTTPLAIKWSIEGGGFIFAVTARMVIGTVCVLLMLLFSSQRLRWHRAAVLTYAAVALQIYGAMVAVYWSAQFIPSGWISVISGLNPLITALLATALLLERSLTLGKLLAYSMGLAGLAVMFGSALEINHAAVLGMIGVLVSISLHSISSVLVKHLAAQLPALSQVAGGLLFALPAYLLTWYLIDGTIPLQLPLTTSVAILYLAVVATAVGFVLYYYLLVHLAATQVALITLVCPVLSLLIGHALNNEPLSLRIVIGTTLILFALLIHSFYDWLMGRIAAKP